MPQLHILQGDGSESFSKGTWSPQLPSMTYIPLNWLFSSSPASWHHLPDQARAPSPCLEPWFEGLNQHERWAPRASGRSLCLEHREQEDLGDTADEEAGPSFRGH